MEPSAHVDGWTDEDERALRRHRRVKELRAGPGPHVSLWPDSEHGILGRQRAFGFEYPTDALRPASFEDRLGLVRNEVRSIRSEVVPYQEPLLYPLPHGLLGDALQLPKDVQPLRRQDQCCLMLFGMGLRPGEGETITSINLRLTYVRPRGLTYSMIPNTELEERFHASTAVELAIATEGAAGLPEVPIAPLMTARVQAGGGVRVGVAWHWRYSVLHATVVNHGAQSGFAEWTISKNGLIGPLELRVLLRIPMTSTRLSLDVSGGYEVRKRFWRRRQRATIVATKVRGHVVAGAPPA
jgi:hypothetical protein